MPTIWSPSDGQWGQKENYTLEESLYSYGGEGVRDGMYENPILHGICRLAGTVVRKRGRGESNGNISSKNG